MSTVIQLLANPQVLAAYFCLSLINGFLGKDRKMGFWGYFFGSLLLTPVIGLLLVMASTKTTKRTDETPKEG